MPPFYHISLQEYLSPEQVVLLEMLIRVIQIGALVTATLSPSKDLRLKTYELSR
jgi:hypothetical protein